MTFTTAMTCLLPVLLRSPDPQTLRPETRNGQRGRSTRRPGSGTPHLARYGVVGTSPPAARKCDLPTYAAVEAVSGGAHTDELPDGDEQRLPPASAEPQRQDAVVQHRPARR